MLRFKLLFPLCLVLLAACAHQVPKAALSKSTESERGGNADLSTKGRDLPNQALSEQVLYQFLLAEISGQRGKLNLSTRAYLEVLKATRDPRIAQRATEVALYARDQAAALEAAKIWLDLEPDSLQPKQTIVALLINTNDVQAAAPFIKQLLVQEKQNLGNSLLQLNRLMEKHANKETVLDLTQDLVQPYLHLPEAHYALAVAAYNADRNQLSLQETDEALKLRADWESAALLRGQVLQRDSNSKAIAYWRQFLSRYPKSKEIRLSYARLLAAEKQHAMAREEFQKLAADFPDNGDVMLAIGALSMQLRDWMNAEKQLKRVLDLNYRDPDTVRYYLGQVSQEQNHFDDALRWYESVTRGDQVFAARMGYAEVLAKQGDLPRAREYLRQIYTQDDRQRVLLVQIEAQLLRDRAMYEEAFNVLGLALRTSPQSTELLYDHAMTADKLNRLEVLEADLRRILEIKPDHANALNALGYTLADRTDRLQEAVSLIEQALKLSPQDAFILDSMGWAQYRLGKHEQALNYLRRAFATRPDPEIAAHLGEVLWSKGKHDEALAIWRGSLKQHPSNEVLQGTLKKFAP